MQTTNTHTVFSIKTSWPTQLRLCLFSNMLGSFLVLSAILTCTPTNHTFKKTRKLTSETFYFLCVSCQEKLLTICYYLRVTTCNNHKTSTNASIPQFLYRLGFKVYRCPNKSNLMKCVKSQKQISLTYLKPMFIVINLIEYRTYLLLLLLQIWKEQRTFAEVR